MSFPPPLLAMKRVVWHTLTGDHDGEEDALLAQLTLPLATRSKRIPADKSILFPTTHSHPCTPVGGTDVPSTMLLRGREEDVTSHIKRKSGRSMRARVLSERLSMPLLHDEVHEVWSLGPEASGRVLSSAVLPSIVLPDLEGKPFALRELRGQKVLLVAWASW